MYFAKILHILLCILTNLLGALNAAVAAAAEDRPSTPSLVTARNNLAYLMLAASIVYIIGLLAAFVWSLYVELEREACAEIAARTASAPSAYVLSPHFRLSKLLPAATAGDTPQPQPPQPQPPTTFFFNPLRRAPTAPPPPSPPPLPPPSPAFFRNPMRHASARALLTTPPALIVPEEREQPEAPPAESAVAASGRRWALNATGWAGARSKSRARGMGEDVSADHNVVIRYVGGHRVATRRNL